MEYLRGFELGLGVYEVDVRREDALIDIIQIITDKQCSSFIEMSRSSHLEMSCSALGMLDGSPRDYGAGHASSDTGDIEHARTRPSEDDPVRGGHGTEARSRRGASRLDGTP